MIGGAGNDTYVVDNAGDVVTEASDFAVPSGWTLKGTADFNNDGELDVVVSSASANQIWLLKNQVGVVGEEPAERRHVGLAELAADRGGRPQQRWPRGRLCIRTSATAGSGASTSMARRC